jgi:outer membrane protein OmpA-like peptidoglycan-associated protein
MRHAIAGLLLFAALPLLARSEESKPTLDKIVAVLKAKPDWKLKIEGHTDSTGGDAHNSSSRRAARRR